MKRAVTTATLIVATGLSLGCRDIVVTGAFGDRALEVAATALGWIDATHYIAGNDANPSSLEERITDETRMHLLFSGVAFDPRAHIEGLGTDERDALADEIVRGDFLSVVVQRASVLRDGDVAAIDSDDVDEAPPEIIPYIERVHLRFGQPILDQTSEYPDELGRLGAERSAKLEVTTLAPRMEGTLELSAAASSIEQDADGVVAGTVSIAFALDLVSERHGECNFSEFEDGVETMVSQGLAPTSPTGEVAIDPCANLGFE